MKVKINLIIIMLLFAVIFSGCSSNSSATSVSNEDFDKVVEITDKGFEAKMTKEELKKAGADVSKIRVRNRKTVIKEMHEMANTLIVADEIWGEIEITDERVNGLILEVMTSNYEDKKFLLGILKHWKDEDFSHGIPDHNYLWRELGGTVGEAYDLRPEIYKEVMKKHHLE